jgi:flagellar hook assembly protein FlgD
LRRALIATLSLALLWLALPVTPALAASSAKVVVIVGPVGGSTAHYKDDANQVVAEAKRYTPNVVKVYTPNATWAKVKSAAQGANVLVYLGHGNGWPSQYAPFQMLTKDGFGLDPSTGADSTKTVYYGEDYIRNNIRLAPNAVVLLYHLCYASGNTEPGLAVGSFANSRERVDNYGAGFIGAGARAVFAEGHPAHPVVNYVRQLFTTNRSMEAIFRSAPTYHGNLMGPYASQRTPGLTFLMDPDTAAPSGFYRSLIGDRTLTASDVVAPPLARTDGHPADFVVPGAAEVAAGDGAGLFATAEAAADPAAKAASTLAVDTRLRVTAEAAPASDGTRILGVGVIGGSAKGFVRATALVPRDSEPVAAWTLDESAAWLSPNGDNVSDGFVAAARFSESAAATLTIKNAAGTTVKSASLSGEIARFAWDLKSSSGTYVADGSYTWKLRAVDAWANAALSRTGSFTIDRTAPVSSAAAEATAGENGWLVSPVTVKLLAKDALSGVRTIQWRVNGGSVTAYDKPASVTGNGTQTFEYRAVDKAGVRETWKTATYRIDTKPPVIALPMSGEAGDAAGTWRGPVTIKPAVKDASSGVASKRYRVDDDASTTAVTDEPIVVTGDGPHTVTVSSVDVAGNRATVKASFVIDTTAPTVSLPEPGASVATVSPNGDRVRETVALPYSVTEDGTLTVVVTGADAKPVRKLSLPVAAGDGTVAWDGRTAAGVAVPDGRYTVTFTARDLAGNAAEPVTGEVDVYSALAGLTRTPSLFFPQDADALSGKTTIAYTLLTDATVTIRVLDTTGAIVRTGPNGKVTAAGARTWAWNGLTDDGAFAPRGGYRIEVLATNGVQAAAIGTTVLADAFKVSTSAATATRGKAMTVTARTAEPLSTTPKLVVRQPGLDPWTVTMVKASATTWTATITPKKGGTAGTMSLVVKAKDSKGGANSSVARLALQ